jgi:hypothetical protein
MLASLCHTRSILEWLAHTYEHRQFENRCANCLLRDRPFLDADDLHDWHDTAGHTVTRIGKLEFSGARILSIPGDHPFSKHPRLMS